MNRRIRRLEEISVFANEYGTLYNDRVLSPNGTEGRYLRWQWNNNGVVAVPVFGDRLAMKWMYRYSAGHLSLEFPRGGIEPGESSEQAASRELSEEFGLDALSARRLSQVYADTGLIENAVQVVQVNVRDPQARPADDDRQEDFEAIDGEVIWMSVDEVMKQIAAGRITCGVSLAALGVFLSSQPSILTA